MEDDISTSKNVMFRPDGCDVNDMCFDVDEFRKLHNHYGPITLDAFASSSTNLCQRYCSDANPFLKHNVKGENVFICPLQSDDVLPMLHHFESIRSLYAL